MCTKLLLVAHYSISVCPVMIRTSKHSNMLTPQPSLLSALVVEPHNLYIAIINQLTLFTALTSAPFSTRTFTASSSPQSAAVCRGLSPNCGNKTVIWLHNNTLPLYRHVLLHIGSCDVPHHKLLDTS